MRKALFIGGTGTISTAVVRRLAAQGDWKIWLLNRGHRRIDFGDNVHSLTADINDEAAAAKLLEGMEFDAVCEFVGFTRGQVERDVRLFSGKTRQYIFTSSASAYHKPAPSPFITEGTSLANPYWQYSRDKIACEDYLMEQYRKSGFPVTIVRPSHTYDENHVTVAVHGAKGAWQVVKRMMEEKPVLIPGDGTSLWAVTFNADFAVGYTGLMGNPHAIGEAFQITGDEILTWNQIYETIADALHVKLNPCHVSSDFLAEVGPQYDLAGALLGDKATSVIFDNSKLKKLVPEMRTNIPFDQGIRIVLDNVLAHPELQVEDPEFDEFCDRIVAAKRHAIEEVLRK
ncbi:MAG: NAD-dependent epimerase/dehydratase family protein [Lachnospiraceae bacterium]|jgi:nucleoside-diphosphate-sugar epimerase